MIANMERSTWHVCKDGIMRDMILYPACFIVGVYATDIIDEFIFPENYIGTPPEDEFLPTMRMNYDPTLRKLYRYLLLTEVKRINKK